MVKMIENTEQFRQVIQLSKTKLVVIDFMATWYVVIYTLYLMDNSHLILLIEI